MNTLNLHILYLSRHHDCVIVPGFGAFIIEFQPSRIDSLTMEVFPPAKIIGFNSELTNDDGLLVHSIVRRERIPHQEAKRMVEHHVQSLKERLEEGSHVFFEGLGKMTLSKEGRKIFTPSREDTLPTCHLPLLSASVFNPSDSSIQISGETITKENKLPLHRSTENSGEDNTKFINCPSFQFLPFSKFIVRVACSLIILIGTVIAFTIPEITMKGPVQKASVVSVETLLNIPQAKISNGIISRTGNIEYKKRAEENATPLKSLSPSEPTPVEKVTGTERSAYLINNIGTDYKQEGCRKETKRYHIIVGTFSTRDEAERFIATTKADTIDLTPIKGRGKLWRVAASSSDNKEALQSELNRLNREFEGCWIWER